MDTSTPSVSHFSWNQHRWRKVLILSLILAAGTIALGMYLQVPMYRASALIMIESSPPYIAFPKGEGLGSLERYVETQKELLLSPVVLSPVLGRPEIAAFPELRDHGLIDPILHLQEHLKINQVGHSDLYQITYESPYAHDAATAANAIVSEYLAIQSNEKYNRSRRISSILENELHRRTLDVERLRQRVVGLSNDVTGRDPFSGRVLDIDNDPSFLARLHKQLVDINIEQEVAQEELQSYRQRTKHSPEDAVASRLSWQEREKQSKTPSRRGALDQIDTLLNAIDELEGPWREHPELVDLTKNMENLQDVLVKFKQELTEQLSRTKQSSSRLQLIAEKERSLVKIEVRKEYLTRLLDKHLGVMKESAGKSIQLEYAQAELAREENAFELIASRKLAIQTELRAPTRVRLRQQASTPSISINPLPYKVLAVSCLAAFVIPIAIAFLLLSSK
jgi:capsular polysaccharide biosynthesis protein